MIGAIAGDIIGSAHEFGRTKSKDFPLFVPDRTFTDDSVLTVAVARAVDGEKHSQEPYSLGIHRQ